MCGQYSGIGPGIGKGLPGRRATTRFGRILRLGAVLFCTGAPAAAAETWQKLPTVPYRLNNKQDALAVLDATTAWYGNGTGRVYRTDDGGAHWRLVWNHPGTYVRAMDFADATTGLLGNVGPGYFPDVTDSQSLYMTHDGGTTWQPVTAVDGPPVKGICAVDILKQDGRIVALRAGGRVGGPAGLMESFDGGRSWQARDMSGVTGMILDIHFVDAQTGFIAGASQSDEGQAHARILRTHDGGKSWQAVFDSPLAGDNNWKLAFPSPRVGYATIISYDAPADAAEGYVVKTEDGGDHWQKLVVTRDHAFVPYGINFISETHGWVGSSTGGYTTQDGGKTWQPVRMGLSTNRIRFVPRPGGGTIAFALGHDLYRLALPPESPPR